MKEKAIYFEYPNEYNEIFEKLAFELDSIDITDHNTYWIKPFQDRHFLKGSEKTKLKINLSPTIFGHLVTDEKEKEKVDEIINEFIKSVF